MGESEKRHPYWPELREVADLLGVGSLKHSGMVVQAAKDVKREAEAAEVRVEVLNDRNRELERQLAQLQPCVEAIKGLNECRKIKVEELSALAKSWNRHVEFRALIEKEIAAIDNRVAALAMENPLLAVPEDREVKS